MVVVGMVVRAEAEACRKAVVKCGVLRGVSTCDTSMSVACLRVSYALQREVASGSGGTVLQTCATNNALALGGKLALSYPHQ